MTIDKDISYRLTSSKTLRGIPPMSIVIVGRSDLEREINGMGWGGGGTADATTGGCHSVAAAPGCIGLRELPDAKTLPVKGGVLNYLPTRFV